MDWANERWIRLYTRDTGDWLMWPWQTRALFLFILRKVDRAGMLQLGKGSLRALAAIVGMPSQDVTEWIEPLLEDGCVQIRDGQLLVPNFIPAQEAQQTDRARQRASRERARDKFVAATGREPTTMDLKVEAELTAGSIDGVSLPVTPAVTGCHTPSRSVTTRQDKTNRQDERESDARAEDRSSERRLKSVPPTAIRDPETRISPTEPSEAAPPPREPEGRESPTRPTGVASGDSESGYDLARRLWSEMWAAKYRRPYDFSPRMGPGSEDFVLQRVGESASIRVGGAEAYLRHKFGAYLRDHGTRGYLDEQSHPLRCLERDWAKYGEPKEPRRMVPRREEPPVELVSVEEMAARAAAAMTLKVGSGGT